MIRCLLILLALFLTGCGPSACVARAVTAEATKTAPATPPPADPGQAKAKAPATGNPVADGVSNATPADVVGWLLPWLAGLLTVGIVGTVAVATWLRSKSLALLAVGLAVGLVAVLWLKLILWTLAILFVVALLAVLGYLARELWQHRAELAKLDPLHHLITRKA